MLEFPSSNGEAGSDYEGRVSAEVCEYNGGKREREATDAGTFPGGAVGKLGAMTRGSNEEQNHRRARPSWPLVVKEQLH